MCLCCCTTSWMPPSGSPAPRWGTSSCSMVIACGSRRNAASMPRFSSSSMRFTAIWRRAVPHYNGASASSSTTCANSSIFMGTQALEVMMAAGARAVQSTPLVNRSGRVLGMFSTHYRHAPQQPSERALAPARHPGPTSRRSDRTETRRGGFCAAGRPNWNWSSTRRRSC